MINIPTRLAGPQQIPFVQSRPTVDVRSLSARAANEVIATLTEHRERQAKAARSFLRRKQARPEVDLAEVAASLRQAVDEVYRVSAAACIPPLLNLDDEHLAEIAALQEAAENEFCRLLLPAVADWPDLLERVYEICPALRPLPEPDRQALARLQHKADQLMARAMSIHEELVEALRELDGLVRHEAQAVAGTSMVGNGRIRRQAEHVKFELVRALESNRVLESLRIPAARWEP